MLTRVCTQQGTHPETWTERNELGALPLPPMRTMRCWASQSVSFNLRGCLCGFSPLAPHPLRVTGTNYRSSVLWIGTVIAQGPLESRPSLDPLPFSTEQGEVEVRMRRIATLAGFLSAVWALMLAVRPEFGHQCPYPEYGRNISACQSVQLMLRKAAEAARNDGFDLGPMESRAQKLAQNYFQSYPVDPGFGRGSEAHYNTEDLSCLVHGGLADQEDRGLPSFVVSRSVKERSDAIHGSFLLSPSRSLSSMSCPCEGPQWCWSHIRARCYAWYGLLTLIILVVLDWRSRRANDHT